ncbi:MAG: hypothetical protein ACXVCK_14010 [Bdellovibrionota bacterium]
MRYFLFALFICGAQAAFAGPYLSTVNCAGPTLTYSMEFFGGGPVPRPGTILGHWVLIERSRQIGAEDIYSGNNGVVPACYVNLDWDSKKVLSTWPSRDPGEAYSNFTIDRAAGCNSGPNSGRTFHENMNCTSLSPNH